ncbi:hypothetical protein DV515_00003924 [Chloebia gouldiae]|uniref:Uncharacterized protein n=1 Tax=Chloebia gouldiae TaxID=44316 RepID=A0A3L8SS05_CHLGU|nr:hypothetical protein DV515_00003924 [Chloebia gouldiae]
MGTGGCFLMKTRNGSKLAKISAPLLPLTEDLGLRGMNHMDQTFTLSFTASSLLGSLLASPQIGRTSRDKGPNPAPSCPTGNELNQQDRRPCCQGVKEKNLHQPFLPDEKNYFVSHTESWDSSKHKGKFEASNYFKSKQLQEMTDGGLIWNPGDVCIGSPKNREHTAARPKEKATDDLAILRKRKIAAGRWGKRRLCFADVKGMS